MLTFGWAFSFLDGFDEAQSGLRASGWRSGIAGRPGNSQTLSARPSGKRDHLQPNGHIWSTKPRIPRFSNPGLTH